MNEYEVFLAIIEKHPEWIEQILADERRKLAEWIYKQSCVITARRKTEVISTWLAEYEKEQKNDI